MKTASKKITANKRAHLYYSGAVQGVGFRYTAERLSNSFKVSGWAKNLSDGRVEMVCEGAEPDVRAFLEKIADVFMEYIRGIDADWSEATGEFTGFDIRF
ncbi:MAG: acylphosphatase [Candidatus Omnitrophica bacterium]|jgi:acylphosphatase|nr:acylphosphatase [Candidatus Omnitrophota bacterium]